VDDVDLLQRLLDGVLALAQNWAPTPPFLRRSMSVCSSGCGREMSKVRKEKSDRMRNWYGKSLCPSINNASR
jgi:hypothetical protein